MVPSFRMLITLLHIHNKGTLSLTTMKKHHVLLQTYIIKKDCRIQHLPRIILCCTFIIKADYRRIVYCYKHTIQADSRILLCTMLINSNTYIATVNCQIPPCTN